jgi:hypothetical protein
LITKKSSAILTLHQVQEKHIQWEASELAGVEGRSDIEYGIDYAEYLFA